MQHQREQRLNADTPDCADVDNRSSESAQKTDYPEKIQTEIFAKIEAFERFINLNALALGLLQVLALERSKTIWQHFPLWFRSLPKHGYPSERIVRLALQNQLEVNFSRSRPAMLLDKLLRTKIGRSQVHNKSDLAA